MNFFLKKCSEKIFFEHINIWGFLLKSWGEYEKVQI